jgi:hypothetical protein
MRCVNCGFPVSPARTKCARCGAAVGTGRGIKENQHAAAPVEATQQASFAANSQAAQSMWEAPQVTWNVAGTPYQQQMAEPTAPYAEGNQQQTFQQWQAEAPFASSFKTQDSPSIGQSFTPSTMNVFPQQTPLALPQSNAQELFPREPYKKNTTRKASQSGRLGFTISGLCVFTGGLLLLFVYFMAQGLPNSSGPQAAGEPGGTQNTMLTTPEATQSISSTPTQLNTPTASPTATYPGQKYIDNAQMASDVNIKSAQPLQKTTKFAVNQRIYVTFSVHADTPGAACLSWYLNGKKIIDFPMHVGPIAYEYSYAYIGASGPAYVEISWASSTACTDKILAQHVDFTVGS